jgi:hypothetical protein
LTGAGCEPARPERPCPIDPARLLSSAVSSTGPVIDSSQARSVAASVRSQSSAYKPPAGRLVRARIAAVRQDWATNSLPCLCDPPCHHSNAILACSITYSLVSRRLHFQLNERVPIRERSHPNRRPHRSMFRYPLPERIKQDREAPRQTHMIRSEIMHVFPSP